jgi:hypothetical protein
VVAAVLDIIPEPEVVVAIPEALVVWGQAAQAGILNLLRAVAVVV